MKLAVFAYSRRGCDTAERVRAALAGPEDQCRCYTMEKYCREGFEAMTPPCSKSTGPVFAWAAGHGLFIDDMAAAKAVSAAILEGPVPLCSDFPIRGELPAGVVWGDAGPVGICISWRKQNPFTKTVLLVPAVVRVGIGCKKGTSAEKIAALVDDVLAMAGVHPKAVKAAASIDLKKEEPGLLAFCAARGWPVEFYTAEELRAVAGDFTPSAFVQSVTGVDNVCERAAIAGAERLLTRKTARDGVTAALAIRHWEVRFDER